MLQQYPVQSSPGGGPSTPTPEAATFVVAPSGGDFTTIAAALAAIVAKGGGYILVREGTYSTATPNVLPVGIPVVIKGCGDATILDLGLLGSFAFTIPDGATENLRVSFENFMVIGQEVANQAVCRYNDSKGLTEVFFDRVNTEGVEQYVRVTDGSFDGTTPGQDDVKLHIFRSRIRPVTTNASIIITNVSPNFTNIRTWMKEVQFEGDNIFAINPPRTDPLWGAIVDDNYFGDVYLDTCEFSLGGTLESQYGVIQAVNCWFTNNDSTQPVVHGFTNGSVTGNGGTVFTGCTLRAMSFDHFDQATYTGCTLDAWHCVTWSAGIFQGCMFTNTYGAPYPFNTPGDDPFIIENFATGTSIIGCFWGNADAWPTGLVNGIQASIIEIFAETTIIGNDFSDVDPPAVVGIIEVFNSNCVIVGNRFPFAPTSGPPMKDWNGSNYYYGNSRLFWRTAGAIIGPAGDGFADGKGLGNVIEGMRSWNGTGAVGGVATNSIIVDYRNNIGLAMVKGYMQNTGANPITVREQYFTQDEGTFTRSTVVVAGAKLNLDPFDFTGLGAGIDFQVNRYTVDVSGAAIAWRVNFSAPGGVYQF